MRLPGNSSRTSTHAISVPKNAFTATTIAEAASVSLSAATACGVDISRQKEAAPPWLACASSAAIGSSTSTDR
jgi:hypothetical protein